MLRVLIADDDLMIAALFEEILLAHGYEVCGIARTVREAVALGLLHKPDLAVIDMWLADGGLGTEIAAQLGSARMGILYVTGSILKVLANAADGDACITKPCRTNDLVRGLEIVAEIRATGIASPPFPSGFRLLERTIT